MVFRVCERGMAVTKYVCARGMGDQISRGKKFEICFHVNSRTGLLINNDTLVSGAEAKYVLLIFLHMQFSRIACAKIWHILTNRMCKNLAYFYEVHVACAKICKKINSSKNTTCPHWCLFHIHVTASLLPLL